MIQDRTGGFLTLEVELGPDEQELEQIRSELESASGTVRLAPVPFINGAVKLVMFGSTGGENQAVDFTVAGSSKPSLIGKQTAVFSLRLGGKEAQIMWSLLKNGSQTQVGICYDLDYLGLMQLITLRSLLTLRPLKTFGSIILMQTLALNRNH